VPRSRRDAGTSTRSRLARTTPPEPGRAVVGKDAALFVNRELSWLEFNGRVLEEAMDPSVPLVERCKFVSIVSNNLDEFFMVRVAGLKQQLAGQVNERTADGMSPQECHAAVSARVHAQVARQVKCLLEDLLPQLQANGVRLVAGKDLSDEQRAFVAQVFRRDIMPALTPLAIDPGHPFPHLRNKCLNLAVTLAGQPGAFSVVQVPKSVGRLIELPSPAPTRAFVLLGEVISTHAQELFNGLDISGCYPFRITRNSDLSIDEDEAEDLLETIEQELRRRERGNAVRLEISAAAPEEVKRALMETLGLGPDDVYESPAPLDLTFVAPLGAASPSAALRYDPFSPRVLPLFRSRTDPFALLSERDVLLHHPYDSFDSVVEFVNTAAADPSVLAIKMTLYRTSLDSPIPRALARAAENGKDVTALVELKARFDEQANIHWARELEESGVHVVYGLIGLKTHCKVCLVVRREPSGIRRYVHMSTGNYNPITARLYTDVGLFTSRPAVGEDGSALFNLLTGNIVPPSWKELVVAPMDVRARVLALIERETALSTKEKPGRIIAKVNSLTDPAVIRALYLASRAGVETDLICRGICCLRPGVAGHSETIRVTSIVDRFLEHSRVFYFGNGQPPGKGELYLSSADWMNRNFERRVEIMFPVVDDHSRSRLYHDVLLVALKDNVKARRMKPDGTYERIKPEPTAERVRSQEHFTRLAREQAEGASPRVFAAQPPTTSTPPRPAGA
jgi:polyphosphate kinase